ncbi:hypothetical protein M8C13_00375 [Crossiella sp. SN42]|uniref:hypothetical protein n=1 Tax=Crossiella sp. SN42 TaxID=2944808 RepID=UPI00207D3BCA|nr:hypothetical protein [Crossiella sp. SN42]MCO1574212.1 hypothetical protein [Crossiella sp. SN42]
MTDLDFYAHFAVNRGEVLGVGIGAQPDEWSKALGNEFDENRIFESSLSRDFGFIVADFIQESGRWSCHLVILQIHKLDMIVEDWDPLPEAVRAVYGEFSKRVTIVDLASVLTEANLSICRIVDDKPAAELENLWIPETSVGISVIRDSRFARSEEKQVGDVYSMHHLPTATVDAGKLVKYHP